MSSKFVVLCEGSKCRVYKVRKDSKGNQFVMKKRGNSMVRFCVKKSHPTFGSRSAAMKVQKSLLKDPKACRSMAKRQKRSVARVPKSKVESMKKDARKAGKTAVSKARKSMKNVDRKQLERLGLGAAAVAAVAAVGWSVKDMIDFSRMGSMSMEDAKATGRGLMEKMLRKVAGVRDSALVRDYSDRLGDLLARISKMDTTQVKMAVGVAKKTMADKFEPYIPRAKMASMMDKMVKLHAEAKKMGNQVGGMLSLLGPRRSTVVEEEDVYGPELGQGMPGYVRDRVEAIESPSMVPAAPEKKSWYQVMTGRYGRRRKRSSHYRRTGRFGRQPSLTQSMGFVRPPFNISMAESYTGMRPRSYLRHAMAPTASPVMMPPGTGVAAANSYYGSYGMGLHLNPQERQPAARFGKKKRKTTKKRKVVKRKVVRKRKPVPKSLKNMAKKHGVKLTVKRGDKRVPKSEKELRRQIRNKMKAKKSAPKRKTVKRRVKRKTRKAPKRKVNFGKRNQFFF